MKKIKDITKVALSEDKRFKWINRLSKLLDEEFKIRNFKFGIDPLLNLIPYAGDITSYIMSSLLVLTMLNYGVSGKVVFKMVTNVILDAIIGKIPILGWIFDFKFKANTRNVELLRSHYYEGKNQGSAKKQIIWVLLSLTFGLFLLIIISVFALVGLFKYFF